MIFSGIVKTSLVDFPDLISCVLFTPGCNFDCWYCHNRQLIDGTHDVLNTDSVAAFLQKRAGQLDGVVLTGGEPTLQPDLLDFMASLKALGYKVKLDTNGADPNTVERILNAGLCDYVAVDWKAPLSRYREFCGSDADAVLETIQLLLRHGTPFEVRTTVVPQLTGDDLLQMARELPQVPLYNLNRYRPPERYKPSDAEKISATPYTAERITIFADMMRRWQPNVKA